MHLKKKGSALTHSQSVFGITTLEISVDDWRFPVTLIAVCIPFFMVICVLQTRWGMRMARNMGNRIDRYTSKLLNRPPSTNPWQTTDDHGRVRACSSAANENDVLGGRRDGRKRPALRDRRTKSDSSSRFSTRSGATRGGFRHGLLHQHQTCGGGSWTWTMTERIGGFFAAIMNINRWSWLMWRRNKVKTDDPASDEGASMEQV